MSSQLQRTSVGISAILILLMHVCLACEPPDLPPLVDDRGERDYTEELHQIIVPSYQFTCHGRVTHWSACVEPGGDRERYDIRFHIWRQTREGCYSLVGSNVPSELLAPEGNCVKYEVPPGDQILVRPGDVIGFYVNRFRQRRKRMSEGSLDDPSGGGVQLDSNWMPSVQTLSTPLDLASGAVVDSELCSVESGGILQLSSVGAPVIAVEVDPIQPSTTDVIILSTIVPTSVTVLGETHVVTSSTSPIPTQEQTTPPSTTPSSSLLHMSSVSPSLLKPTLKTTSLAPVINPIPTATAAGSPTEEITHVQTTSTQTPPQKMTSSSVVMTSPSVVITSSSVVMTSSSSVVMTSSPPPEGRDPTGKKVDSQPLLIGGLVVAGVLLVAIVALVIALIMVCCSRSKGEEDKEKSCQGDDDMDYCEAYALNNSTVTTDYTPKAGMVWNTAYRSCSVEEGNDPVLKKPQAKQPQRFTIKDDDKYSPPATLTHNYTNVYNIHRGSNDYEEVF